jgi:hypothetical protein
MQGSPQAKTSHQVDLSWQCVGVLQTQGCKDTSSAWRWQRSCFVGALHPHIQIKSHYFQVSSCRYSSWQLFCDADIAMVTFFSFSLEVLLVGPRSRSQRTTHTCFDILLYCEQLHYCQCILEMLYLRWAWVACVSTSHELLGLDANGTTLTCVAMGVV